MTSCSNVNFMSQFAIVNGIRIHITFFINQTLQPNFYVLNYIKNHDNYIFNYFSNLIILVI